MKISRVGAPHATVKRGSTFSYQVRLSAAPDDDWISRFWLGSPNATSRQAIAGIRFTDCALEFNSAAADLLEWVVFIDGWIGQANRSAERGVDSSPNSSGIG